MSHASIIAASEFFSGANPTIIDSIAARADERTLVRGDVLFKEGDTPDALYIVLSGRIAIAIDNKPLDSRESVVALMTEGDLFATIYNTLGINPRRAIEQVVEPYVRPKALQYLEEGKVVIFAAGTGNPFFTTDTAAALRGAEIGAEIVLKATKVDGVYSADPKLDPTATRYATITFDEAISRNLQVMDATAFALCRDQKLPIKVFSIFKPGALRRVVDGEDEGTLVHV